MNETGLSNNGRQIRDVAAPMQCLSHCICVSCTCCFCLICRVSQKIHFQCTILLQPVKVKLNHFAIIFREFNSFYVAVKYSLYKLAQTYYIPKTSWVIRSSCASIAVAVCNKICQRWICGTGMSQTEFRDVLRLLKDCGQFAWKCR